MLVKKIFIYILIGLFLLTGCAPKYQSSSSPVVGPQTSSSLTPENSDDQVVTNHRQRLDVIIPVFNPGLPEDPEDYHDENIWPEIRRAEANRFAWKMKEALDRTDHFGAVRVTPDATATGDLYLLGTIDESNGEEVEISLQVIDISNRQWLKASYDHDVSETFYRDQRNKQVDPYDPVFQEAAMDIAEELERFSNKELARLHDLAEMRFGANFSEESFMPYMQQKHGRLVLTSKPNPEDPMYKRIKAIRVRDQLFVDGLQHNYASFSQKMNESYMMWQEQSFLEAQALSAANKATIGKAVGGVLMIGLAVLAAIAGAESDSIGSSSAGATGAIIGGMVGSRLIQDSFKTNQEAQIHRETLNELGRSLDMEFAPQVIAFEKETIELRGNAREQFSQWREFLQQIYNKEATPEVSL
jgi:hypothetical protein